MVALLIGGGAVLAVYLYEKGRTGNIYRPHARFVAQPTPVLPRRGPERFAWPLYGYSKNHTRFYPASAALRPPFDTVWEHNYNTLLEFPPVIWGPRLFQLGDDGVLVATGRRSGHVLWHTRVGALSASTPAASASTLYVTLLASRTGSATGRVVAVNAVTGRIRWIRELPSPSESSPMLDRGRLFLGSQDGTVYALAASNGRTVWTYHAGGAVKASPTLSGGVLYFGDYSGRVQAISESSGRRIWASQSEGALLGSGTFYSTSAVIYGRVFLGNTDGHVYCYDAASGRLDWAVQTGGYVYASPAVTNAPGLGPTVYVGSYSGEMLAINARSGQVSWRFDAHGRISGSSTIIGSIVYFSVLGTHRTYGLSISTGRVLYETNTGAFDPVISDGTRIFLTGTTGIYALLPRSAARPARPSGRSGRRAGSG